MFILPPDTTRILITGGSGFIGGAVIRRLLKHSTVAIFNLDKFGYASDLTSINNTLEELGGFAEGRYQTLKVDLLDLDLTKEAIDYSKPDLILHLAAESHVDRSIANPSSFVESNIIGTFNLLQASLNYWENLPEERRKYFRLHHISTDEVFGSLGDLGKFSEKSNYHPRSPYSASKASSDHLMQAWYHTYGLPIIISNCSNNYGPWQFPEKLIPMVILKAINGQPIPIYGDGKNIRDWLYVYDHVEALLMVATNGELGETYCIGGDSEKTNRQVVELICNLLDELRPNNSPHTSLIDFVEDRPGHDRRYAIDLHKINSQIGWKPNHRFEDGIRMTVNWYLANLNWCNLISRKSNYNGERIGILNNTK